MKKLRNPVCLSSCGKMSRYPCSFFILLFTALVTLSFPGIILSKSLYWESLDVQARLESDGRLHVTEEQHFVFDGDWNGGERIFRLGYGHRLSLQGISRVDPETGEVRLLKQGSLTKVDHYNWYDAKTLRWRSRLPTDPPFHRQGIIYIIEYTLSNILVANQDSYLLDHDFAFPDRRWPINRFSLTLDLDPVWQSLGDFSGSLVRGKLDPGQSVVVTVPLHILSDNKPLVAPRPPAQPRKKQAIKSPGTGLAVRLLLLVVLAIMFCWRAWFFYQHEKQMGRFAALEPAAEIDPDWLAKNLFIYKPEVVGAAWDKTTSGPEVAAVIARLVAEGKLETNITVTSSFFFFSKDMLFLKLLRDRNSFSGYERKLIDALFIDGDTTDTERIRAHYKSTGFDPAAKIKEPLGRRVKQLTSSLKDTKPFAWVPSSLLALVAFPFFLVACFKYHHEFNLVGQGLFVIPALYAAGMVLAYLYCQAINWLKLRGLLFIMPLLVIVGLLAELLITGRDQASIWLLTGFLLLVMAMINSIFNMAKSKDSAAGIQVRKKMAAGRGYFKQELQKEQPDLLDDWFPYLIAFGLGKNVDRWFKAYGSRYSTTGGISSSGGSGGFTGGGGKFGGGGASGSWASVAGTLAAGVAAPSSSGGGGGGGSSGGGGGGGW